MLFGAAPSGPFAPSTTPKQLPSVDGLVAHQAAPAAAAPVAVRPNVTSAGLGVGSSSSPFGTIGSSQQQQQLGGDVANNISSYDALFGVGNSASSLDVTSFWTGGGGFAAAGHSLDELHSPTTTAAAAAVGTGATPTHHHNNSNNRGASAEPPVQYATMDDALMALGRRVKSFRVVAGADLDRYATAFHAGAATRQFPPDTELRQVFVGQLPALLTADRLAAALGAMTDCPDMPTLVHIRSGQTQASHALVTVESKRAKALLGLNRRAYLTDKALYFAHAFRDIPDFQRVVSKAINATTKEGMQRLALACVVLEKTRRPVTCGTPTSNGSAPAAPLSPEKQQPSSSSPTAVQQQQHAPVLRVQQPSFPATTGGAAASFTPPPPPTLPPYMATPPPMYATASHHLQHHLHHHHHQHQHPHAFYAAHHHAAAAAMMLNQSAPGGGFNPQSHRAATAATATTTMLDANGRPQQGMFVWVPMPEPGTA